MSLPSNRLVGDLLEFAESSARSTGRSRLSQIVFRRAISSAYYALFHTLCWLCADTLVGWSRTGEIDPIYRLIDHGAARKVLRSSAVQALDSKLERVGAIFSDLQDLRYDADYNPPGRKAGRTARFTLNETIGWISTAREAATIVAELDASTRRKLAILLIAKSRRS